MKPKTNLIILLLFLGVLVTSTASVNEPEPCSGYERGTITLKNGKTLEAYIYIDYCNSHLFQMALRTIDEKTYKKYAKGKKIKKKAIEKYKVKEIRGFVLESGKEFRQVKYANLFSQKNTDKLPRRQLLEVVADGKITIFKRGYRTQNGFIYKPVMDAVLAGGPEHVEFMRNNFEILYQKDRSKNPKNIRNANLKNLFGDNPEVLQKFQNGDYSFRIEFQREASFSANCDRAFLDALLEMVQDYNGTTQEVLVSYYQN
ncbi:hypothetical protein [Lentiprolixibacter aurantiacus]|uniref:Uncharacterized protein n=1 Tax=Lentiprolixibacter aurantiacus TaxID=2993939 RepID=A0AAE3MMF9_9FLAO|nr:hypothetical protein [Lentiprolixibacter aurantiacus]MCX2719574.1 hypothetical protein [Lentiprolixibacter aurantiacus]